MSTLPLSHPHHRSNPIHHDPQAAALEIAADEERERQKAAKDARFRARVHVLGRMLLASLFVTTALVKAFQFDQASKALAAFGVYDSSILLAGAIAIELVGGLMLLTGWRTKWASYGMISYLAVTTLLVNNDLSVALNRSFILANLAIAGGLLLLAADGPGNLSVEKYQENRDARRAL